MNCAADECGHPEMYQWIAEQYPPWAQNVIESGPIIPFIARLEDLPSDFAEQWESSNCLPVAFLRYRNIDIPLWSKTETGVHSNAGGTNKCP